MAVVGFQKTGTTSLQVALEYLGYDVARPEWLPMKAALAGDLDALRDLASAHEAWQDMPWFLFFRELDEWFPGTKFVLTVRDEDAWMRSRRNHFGRPALVARYARIQALVFGDVPLPEVDEAPYRARYRAHNEAVLAHFANRPDDLVVIELGQGDEWGRLCGHLGLEPPLGKDGRLLPFPHTNLGSTRDERSTRTRIRRLQRVRRVVVAVGGRRVAERLGRQRRRLAVRRGLRRAAHGPSSR